MNTLADINVEKAVLGQLIIEPDAYLKISDELNADDFYEDNHKIIFEAIQNVFKDNRGIDILTVSKEAKQLKNDISAYQITELTSGVASASHLEYHAKIIKDYAVRRKLLKEIERLKQFGESTENDLDEFIDNSTMFVDRIINEVENRSQIKDFDTNLNETIQSIQEKQADNKDYKGIRTSLSTFKIYAPTWEPGDLIVLAARPGMGKTAFAIHELLHISKQYGPVIFFSLEMSAKQLVSRILQRESNLSRYDFERMTPAKWTTLDNAVTHLTGLNFFIDDTPGVSISHIRAKTKIFKKQHDIKAIAVDYVQLMKADKKLSREQQVADISRNMKLIAKEFDVPVFMVAQLNRGPENRKEDAFRPKLSDLRESGAIEQDADLVIFPHRPAYYLPDDPEFEGRAEIIFAKNRQGSTGMAVVKVNETITKFYDIINDVPDDYTHINNLPY